MASVNPVSNWIVETKGYSVWKAFEHGFFAYATSETTIITITNCTESEAQKIAASFAEVLSIHERK